MRSLVVASLLALVVPVVAAQENPLAPGGKQLPPVEAKGLDWPSVCGGWVDPERELALAVWDDEGPALGGELSLGGGVGSLPIKLTANAAVGSWSGTFEHEGREVELQVREIDARTLELSSGGVKYSLLRVFSAARLKALKGQMEEAEGDLEEARMHGNEAAAIGALKTLVTAQMLFREGDKENDQSFDYAGSLKELADAQIIDEVLGSGTKQGYRYELIHGAKAPEFLWAATASPIEPGKSGSRWFFTNQAGVIYYSTKGPIAIPADCKEPPGVTPVGRAEPDGKPEPTEPAGPEENERRAIGSLKTICTAQSLFREGDKENDQVLDYGTLAELGAAELIDAALGSGKRSGYAFEVRVSKENPEFVWGALASPLEPGKTGKRWLFINQAGVVFYAAKPMPFPEDDRMQVPEGMLPVGK